jgi:hypothetical protein
MSLLGWQNLFLVVILLVASSGIILHFRDRCGVIDLVVGRGETTTKSRANDPWDDKVDCL